MKPTPMVSVRLATYHQETWIAQCLESVVMQRTDFPFEVVVGEDGGTDRTRDIVQAYAGRHPDLIRLLPAEPNLGPMRNSARIQQACRGKYHAMLEGDDYWIDPLKLQRQVDFLEAHPGVSVCIHNAFILNEAHGATRLYYETPFGETLSFDTGLRITFPTASVMARSAVLASLPEWRLKIWCGDLLFRLWCAHHGGIGYLDQIMSVYRRHPGGLESVKTRDGHKAYFDNVYFTLNEFDKETGFAHTGPIQREIARLQREERHLRYRRSGRWYLIYLTQPGQIAFRLGKYTHAIRQQRLLFR